MINQTNKKVSKQESKQLSKEDKNKSNLLIKIGLLHQKIERFESLVKHG